MSALGDRIFAPPSPLPFPAGTGPFRQKGNGYLGDLAYIDKCVTGGAKSVVATLPEPALRAFLEQRFRGSEWYDAFPCCALHAATARLRGLSFAEHRRQVGEYHARSAGAVYRALLRVVSNESIAIWGPRVSSLYFEFGKSETRATAPNEVTGVRKGMPAGLVQFVLCASKGFIEESLILAGATSSRVEIGRIQPEGRAHAHELYSAEVSIRWT